MKLNKIVFCLIFAISCVFSVQRTAPAATDLSPILDSNTIAVIRIDLQQFDVSLIQSFLAEEAKSAIEQFKLVKKEKDEWTMTAQGGITLGAAYVQPIVKKLREEGKIEELFLVVDKKAIMEQKYPFFIVTPAAESKPKEEVDAIRKLFIQNQLVVSFQRHGFVFGIPEVPNFGEKAEIMSFVKERLANPSSEKRPEINTAFAASSASAQPMIQAVVGNASSFEEFLNAQQKQMQDIPEEMLKNLPPAMKESMELSKKVNALLVKELEYGVFSLDIKKPELKTIIKLKTAAGAKEYVELSEKSMKTQIEMLKQMQSQMGQGMGPAESGIFKSVEEMTKLYKPTLNGSELTGTFGSAEYVKLKTGVIDIVGGMLLPAVTAARGAARRMECTNNMKQILLSFHNYHDANHTLPPAYSVDKNGKPLHSWRVLILPYIEQNELYKKIKLDEPWDSTHNKQFHNEVVSVYACSDGDKTPGMTDYSVVVGKETPFGTDGKGVGFAAITDGTSNTIAVVHRATPVNWMCPDQEITFAEACKGIGTSEKGIGGKHTGGTNFGLFDGSVQFVSETIDLNTLKALLDKSDGKAVSLP